MSREVPRQRARSMIDCAIRDLEYAMDVIAELAKTDQVAAAEANKHVYEALDAASAAKMRLRSG